MRRHRPQRNWGARVHETTLAGLDAVVLENARLRVSVLTGKGGDVVELAYKPLDLDFAWLSPGGVRDPRTLSGDAADPLAGFMESYPGGWQEVLPNGGAPAAHAGARYGQHGEVALVPWDHAIVRDGEDGVTVRLEVALRTVPLRLVKELSLEGETAALRVEETLANESGEPVDVMWGHHIVFGRPFLRPDCRIELPAGVARPGLEVVPAPGAPSDIHYLSGFGDEGAYTIRDPERAIGMRVRWDARTMPYLWVWRELAGTRAYPWWGRAHVVGLEPFTSRPTAGLAEAVANGTALRLAPRERRRFDLTATVQHDDPPTTSPAARSATA
jgi:hypothetical protein